MTREEHLQYCKVCLNRKIDFHKGMICTLTNEIADFSPTCENFKEDPIEFEKISKLKKIESQEEIKKVTAVSSGAQWFLWIFGLSVINSVILYSGGAVSFIFGLGITQFFEAMLIGYTNEYTINGLIISILISGIFYLIWYAARKLNKNAFIIGMILYGLDGLLLLAFQDWFSFGVHVYALFLIFKAYQNIDTMKKLMAEQEELK